MTTEADPHAQALDMERRCVDTLFAALDALCSMQCVTQPEAINELARALRDSERIHVAVDMTRAGRVLELFAITPDGQATSLRRISATARPIALQ